MKFAMIALAVAAVLASAPASAQVSLDNAVLREVVKTAPDGSRTTTLAPAKTIAPNGIAVYVMTYRNGGARPASNLVIDNRVPADVVYVGPGANSPAPAVSVDGGRSFGQISTLTVRGPNGQRAAQFADVTNVRWTIQGPVAPGSTGSVAYRARVR